MSPASGFIQLPDNDAIKIFAITVADNPYDRAEPLQPLYDDFSDRQGFDLKLEKRIVKANMTPMVNISATVKRNLNDLPYRITMKDYADMHMPNGVVVKYFYSGTEKLKQKDPDQGLTLTTVNDGMFDLLPSDSSRDVTYEKGEGRIVMDLQQSIDIDSIHLFSALETKKGAQRFSVWISEKEEMPAVSGDPKPTDWKYLGSVIPEDIWGNGKIVYSVIPKKGQKLNGRYIMWITEDSAHGPFLFREADVFAQ